MSTPYPVFFGKTSGTPTFFETTYQVNEDRSSYIYVGLTNLEPSPVDSFSTVVSGSTSTGTRTETDYSIDYQRVTDADFVVTGLSWVGVEGSHAVFRAVDFDDAWTGSIELNATYDFVRATTTTTTTTTISPPPPPAEYTYTPPTTTTNVTNASYRLTQANLENLVINLEADTIDPYLVSIVAVPSAPTGFTYAPDNGEYLYLVTFSDEVMGTSNGAYLAPAGFRVDEVIAPTTSGYGSDKFLVVVKDLDSTYSLPTTALELIEPLTVTGVTSGVGPINGWKHFGEAVSGGTWYKLQLSKEVPGSILLNDYGQQANWTVDDFSEWALPVMQLRDANSNLITMNVFSVNPSTTDGFIDEVIFQTNQAFDSANFYVQFNNYDNNDVRASYFGQHIIDTAGNPLDFNNQTVSINSSTLPSNNTSPPINPSTIGGFDTLKINFLAGVAGDHVYIDATSESLFRTTGTGSNKVTTFYDFAGSEFTRYEITAKTVDFMGNHGIDDVVALSQIGGNDIQLRSEDGVVGETDIIDYSDLTVVSNTAGITIDLGVIDTSSNNNPYVIVSFGSVFDHVSGAEGVVGTSGNDTITGDSFANVLVGGGGNDRLDGDAGVDVLLGGQGSDVLQGGAGLDILFDLDGAVMRGGTDDRSPQSQTPKDIFIVRGGSSIEDYHTANSGAGLAGRAIGNINDVIVFNMAVGVLLDQIYDQYEITLSKEELLANTDEIRENIEFTYNWHDDTTVSNNDYWQISANSSFLHRLDGSTTDDKFELVLGEVKVKTDSTVGAVVELAAVPLNNAIFDSTGVGTILSNHLDTTILNNVIPDFMDVFEGDETQFNLAFALESVAAGTVRASANGLMFGNFNFVDPTKGAIFNPGQASEKIFGSRANDRYDFLVQDFTPTVGTPEFVGNDIIRDIGGSDAVTFSGMSLADIADLKFEAVKVGREQGKYSLRTNYTQSEEGIATNTGSITWTGHFREGFDMELEEIKLGSDTLQLATNVFQYNQGKLVSATPIQQAMENKDTIMVGNAGKSTDRNIFKLKDDGDAGDTSAGIITSVKQSDLYIWGIDTLSDVIDLSDFIKPTGAMPTGNAPADIIARNAWMDTYIRSKVADDGTYVAAAGPDSLAMTSFGINLDSVSNDIPELTIHFMGPTVTATSLEDMIARAYSTSV